MGELMTVLAPIALLDSLSMLPLAIVPLAILLGGGRPAGALAFLLGVLAIYLPFGLLLLFGLDAAIAKLTTAVGGYLRKVPDAGDLILQLIIGLALLALAWFIASAREKRGGAAEPKGPTPFQAFSFSALLTLSGIWGALPYFAAVDQILRADPGAAGKVAAMVFYNLVFLAPMVAFIVLRYLVGPAADRAFSKLAGFFTVWGKRLAVFALLLLGLVLVADSIGYFAGHPLLPVFE